MVHGSNKTRTGNKTKCVFFFNKRKNILLFLNYSNSSKNFLSIPIPGSDCQTGYRYKKSLTYLYTRLRHVPPSMLLVNNEKKVQAMESMFWLG